jgi:hypothetical protein
MACLHDALHACKEEFPASTLILSQPCGIGVVLDGNYYIDMLHKYQAMREGNNNTLAIYGFYLCISHYLGGGEGVVE